MNLWGRPSFRHYTHDLPHLGGRELKRLLTLTDTGWRWISSRGRPIEFHPVESGGNHYQYRVVLKRGSDRMVSITPTATQFNGLRWWFVCPHCQRRKGKLYWSDEDIGCRKCFGLHYASQSEGKMDRMREMIRKRRADIWGDAPYINDLFESSCWFPKPKGMRQTPFQTKRKQLLVLESAYWGVCSDFVSKITGKQNKSTDDIGSHLLTTLSEVRNQVRSETEDPG